MTRSCTVCAHPKRDIIEKCLVMGDTLRDVARQYGVSKDALWRHKNEHLSLYSPAVAGNPDVIARSDDLLGQLKDLIQRTLAALDRAEAGGDDRMVLLAVREARSNLELMIKVQAYIADREAMSGAVNITMAPPTPGDNGLGYWRELLRQKTQTKPLGQVSSSSSSSTPGGDVSINADLSTKQNQNNPVIGEPVQTPPIINTNGLNRDGLLDNEVRVLPYPNKEDKDNKENQDIKIEMDGLKK